MKLPNANQAVVEREKIADYLLNRAHPDDAGRAAFFVSFGLRRDDSPTLAEALCKLAGEMRIGRLLCNELEMGRARRYVLPQPRPCG